MEFNMTTVVDYVQISLINNITTYLFLIFAPSL